MTRKRAVRALGLGTACAVVALVLAVAAGAGGTATPQPKNGGTLVIGLAEEPDALDPTLARTFVGRIVFLHMCEKLYDLDAKLHIVPQLAAGAAAGLEGQAHLHDQAAHRASSSTTARRSTPQR